MRSTGRKSLLAAATLALGPAAAYAGSVAIDTFPGWDGNFGLYYMGPTGLATIGQTFQTPDAAHRSLDRFAVDWATYFPYQNHFSLTYHVFIYAWNGTNITGTPLFSSGTLQTSSNTFNYIPVTFDTGGTLLTPGQRYLLFATISNPSDMAASNGLAIWSLRPTSPYADGSVVWNFGTNTADLTDPNQWFVLPDEDLTFRAEFSDRAVPLPSAASTGFLSLAGLAAAKLLRHRRAAGASGCGA